MENEQVETMKASQSLSDHKGELLSSIGLFIGMGLLGFWFGVESTLGAKMVNSLEELISIKQNGRRRSSATSYKRTTTSDKRTAMSNYKEPEESRSW